MEKSKIFISSSESASTMAVALRDELEAASYSAMLWAEPARCQSGISIDQTIYNAAQQFDVGLIVMCKEDFAANTSHSRMRSRDNCVFEAGLLSARMGRERCFLVHSVDQDDLPETLRELKTVQFEQPPDVADSTACARAMRPLVNDLRDALPSDGGTAARAHVPLLSVDELFDRERPHSEGGDLREGAVIVCDTQPQAGSQFAVQVGDNIKNGTTYHYFFYFCDETVDKVMQALQMMLVGSVGGKQNLEDFRARVATVKKMPDRIVSALSDLNKSRGLLVTLLADPPQFCFRFHNASDPTLAKLYARYLDRGYLLWETGSAATSMWRSVPKFIDASETDRIFVPLRHYSLDEEQTTLLERSLSKALARYFPGIEAEIKRICVGTTIGS